MAEAVKLCQELGFPALQKGGQDKKLVGYFQTDTGTIIQLVHLWKFDDDPRKYQSGETDVTGRISKIGDGAVRTVLYEAANVILTRPVKGSALKSWAMRLAVRAGMRKAKVALARKLAVVLHRMLADETSFFADKAAAARNTLKKEIVGSGGHDISRPEQGPVAGTMDQVRPHCYTAAPIRTTARN
jgi:hypothetical protein